MNKLTRIILTATTCAFLACGSLEELQVQNYQNKPTTHIYESKSVPSSWGFTVKGCQGSLPDIKDTYIEGNKLFIKGYSRVWSGESYAYDDANDDAKKRVLDLTGETQLLFLGMMGTKFKICKVEKDGKTGYAVEALYSIPIKNLSKEVLDKLPQSNGF